MIRSVSILGIRGIPARHGGFETFAERFALYLAQRGWQVTVYCQEQGSAPVKETEWHGVRRVHIAVAGNGAASTAIFDWRSIRHARREGGRALVLGYNTAVLALVFRLASQRVVFNMDGIEWRRAKWSMPIRVWLYLNDWAGCLLGTHLIADHPRIADHLATRVSRKKITMIPYGADHIENATTEAVRDLGLQPGRYLCVIARPEPENSILEIVRAFSRAKRNFHLLVLGTYDTFKNAYHAAVRNAAGDEVIFPGAIYEKERVAAIRAHAAAYVHGHQVGGTNPSLVEALGAGSAVIAHDNPFNRWVAGPQAAYFDSQSELEGLFDALLSSPDRINEMRRASLIRYQEAFTWDNVLSQYERLLEQHLR